MKRHSLPAIVLLLLAAVLAIPLSVSLSSALSAQSNPPGPSGSNNSEAAPAGVGPARLTPASKSVSDFRPIGEIRVWSFYAKQQTFGQLSSKISGTEKVDGREGVVVQQKLQIDYNRIGTDRRVDIHGQTVLAEDGRYLGTDYQLAGGETTEKLKLQVNGNKVGGTFTRAGQEVPAKGQLPRSGFAWDQYFVDELEVYLALHDLNVGDTLSDTLFLPQMLVSVPIKGVVKWWMWQEIYKGFIDSVYIIRFSEPEDLQAYFTEDKRLLRLDFNNQSIRVYQDIVQKPKGTEAATSSEETSVPLSPSLPSYGWRNFVLGAPHYIVYLLIALGTILLLTRTAYKVFNAYVVFGLGIVTYILMPFTQEPLIRWLVETMVLKNLAQGGSLYTWGMIPPLATGIFQTIVITGALYGFFAWRNPREQHFGLLGVCFGAAFGLAESVYMLGTSIVPLADWLLFERLFWIIFHASIGGLLGLAIIRATDKLAAVAILSVLTNAFLRYQPVLVQTQAVDLPLARIIIAFCGLVVLVLALFALTGKKAVPKPSSKEV